MSESLHESPQATRGRYLVGVLLFVTVVINYLDRSNLSVAAPRLAEEMTIDSRQMGLVLSAFGWTYAALQVPGGWLVDRIAPRLLYPAAIALWSLATAIAFYTSGQFVGLAFLTPVLIGLQQSFGWQTVFLVTGGVGLLWAAIWYAVYREPREASYANDAELALIGEGGGLVDLQAVRQTRQPFRWADLVTVLSHRKLWGMYLGQFCLTSTLWFFLTWFPTYLVSYRGMDFIKAGLLASLPFLAAFVGVLCSGAFSDFLVRSGCSLGLARKLPIIVGLLISTSIVGANFVESPTLVIGFLSLAFFGNGLASITWSLVSAIAPARLIGLTGGMFNFLGNLASVGVPLAIGWLVQGEDFSPAISFIGLTALAGAFCYGVVVGRVERIDEGDMS